MIIAQPDEFALVTALYRSSIDGRRWMYEAILSEDGEYNLPDNFTSRTAEIMQVYLKTLGVKMETIFDETEFIGEPEHENDLIEYVVGDTTILCSTNEMYYLNKLRKAYHRYIKAHPNTIDDVDEVWDWILDNIPKHTKKDLTEAIIDLFKENLEAFSH